MKRTYTLTRAADADIDAIFDYTKASWGVEQALAYTNGILNTVERLLDNPKLGPARPQLSPDLRGIRYEKHTIYYRLRDDMTEIVAVLHEAQRAEPILSGRRNSN